MSKLDHKKVAMRDSRSYVRVRLADTDSIVLLELDEEGIMEERAHEYFTYKLEEKGTARTQLKGGLPKRWRNTRLCALVQSLSTHFDQ
jgi:GTP cyclohydrolase II